MKLLTRGKRSDACLYVGFTLSPHLNRVCQTHFSIPGGLYPATCMRSVFGVFLSSKQKQI